ncbi:hypothetical protein [Actinocorallia sp. B10E7]
MTPFEHIYRHHRPGAGRDRRGSGGSPANPPLAVAALKRGLRRALDPD